jgi:hypothetical protein
MRSLLSAELLKWRRSWFPYITLLGGLTAPLLMALAFYLRKEQMADYYTSVRLLQQITSFQGMMTGSLVAVLIATQLFFSEFQHDTWKLSLTAPRHRWQIFAVKTLVSIAWMLLVTAVAGAVSLVAVPLLQTTGDIDYTTWAKGLMMQGAFFTVLMPFYHFLTLLARNFFVTTGVGIALTVGMVIFAQSKYVGFTPNGAGLLLLQHLTTGEPLPPEALGTPAIWIACAAAIFVAGLLASLVRFVRADFK